MDLARSVKNKEELIRDFRTEAIVEAARRVIARRGLAEASVERIAEEAGIAKGTLYLYFKSKDSLLRSACEHATDDLVRDTRAAISRVRGAPEQLREVVRVGMAHGEQHRAILQVLADAPGLAGWMLPAFRPYLRLIASVIERGVRSGELRRVDGRWLARALVEMMRVAVEDPPRGSRRGTRAELIVDVLVHGIGTGEHR